MTRYGRPNNKINTTKKVSRPNFRQYLRDKIDMKIRVTPELSEELQKICLEEGVKWTHRLCFSAEVANKKEPFLFIVDYGYSGYSMVYSDCEDFFHKQNRPSESTEYDPETDSLIEEPKPVVKESFTPEPMTIEETYKAFLAKKKIYCVGDDYLDEIDLAKYDYLKITRDSITIEVKGLLVTDLKNTYKTHADAYKVFASRRRF